MNESFNPYSPPKANVEETIVAEEREEAGKGRRFATYLIDYILINVVMFVIGVLSVMLMGEAGVELLEGGSNIVLAIAVFLLYYIFFEGLWARTPAKFMLGTVVVMEDGSKPPFGKVVIRTLCRCIPFEPFSFFGDRGWHDGISDTRVVSTRG